MIPRPVVTVCCYCADAAEQTAAARAHGHEVSHGICLSCQTKVYADLDAIEASR